MGSITPEIAGQGAEEDYQDALRSVESLLRLIREDTSTVHGGRCKYELLWLRQEMLEGRLQLPIRKRALGTIRYVFAHGLLADLPGFDEQCSELLTVLDYGLVKPRHYPVIVAMIEDAIEGLRLDSLSDIAQTNIKELRQIRALLLQNSLALPLQRVEEWPGIRKTRWSREPVTDRLSSTLTALQWILTTAARPQLYL